MFEGSIPYYDRIYAEKDYAGESEKVRAIVAEQLGEGRRRLLDVACGTGRHLEQLATHHDVEGLDVSAGLLAIARDRLGEVPLHEADMRDFDLGATFDVVTCLFSSIGYLTDIADVARAASCFRRHLRPDGLLLVEPWFTPAEWRPHTVHASFVDRPDLKIARVNTSYRDGRLSYFDLHHLVGTPERTEHFVERHEMGLYETDELRAVFEDAGFDVDYDAEGLIGRGLFVGRCRS